MANEKRLIDAHEMLRFLENEIDKHKDSLNKWEKDYVKAVNVTVKLLQVFPTVDAVEVVRCKDCKHYKPQNKVPSHHGTVNYCKRVVSLKMPPEGFCCYGERKDND